MSESWTNFWSPPLHHHVDERCRVLAEIWIKVEAERFLKIKVNCGSFVDVFASEIVKKTRKIKITPTTRRMHPSPATIEEEVLNPSFYDPPTSPC